MVPSASAPPLPPTPLPPPSSSRTFQAFRSSPFSFSFSSRLRLSLRALIRSPRPPPTILLLLLLAAAALLLLLLLLSRVLFRRPAYTTRENAYMIPHRGYTGPSSCALHGLLPLQSSPTSPNPPNPRRVVDLIMFNREFEVLEMRLRELDPVVDTFVIVESDRSHANTPKPLYFLEQGMADPRFLPFLDRIVHVTFATNHTDPYVREILQRTDGFRMGAEKAGLRRGDLVIVADADEIPRASVLDTLRHCSGYPKSVCLASRSYYLSFEFEHETYWHYPNVITFDPDDDPPGAVYSSNSPAASEDGYVRRDLDPKHVPLGDYRTDSGVCIADAGWHCSFCFRDAERVRDKLASTMHVKDGSNSPGQRSAAADYAALYQRYCDGEDPLGGAWHRYRVLHSLVGLPQWVLDHPEEYAWLLPGNCEGGRRGEGVLMEPGAGGVRRWDGELWHSARGRGRLEG